MTDKRHYQELPRQDGEVCVGFWHDDGARCWHYAPTQQDCSNPNGEWHALRIGVKPE